MMNRIRTFFRLLVLGFKMGWQWFWGAWKVSRINKPIITIFGGKLVGVQSSRAQQAKELAYKLVERGFFILTGGGPGTMEAVHCGAEAHDKTQKDVYSLGIGVKGLDETFESECRRAFFATDSFNLRKWLLIYFAKAIIIFPGGYGTADELFNVLDLLKLRRIGPLPVILVDRAFWQPIERWVFDVGLKEGTIAPGQEHLFTICDTNEEILKVIDEQVHA